MKMKIYQEICVFFVSLSAPVLLYIMNNVPTFHEPLVILGTGLAVSGAMFLLAFLSVQHKQPKDILFYVCVQFAFTSVLKLANALEQDGFTSGFVGFYQRKGEPCMVTAYAIVMCYWDGVVHFLLYLLLLHHRAKAKLYRGMGLFWAGSSFASMSVFIPGSVIGKYGSNIYPAFWLNVLLLLGSVWVAASLLSSLRELPVIPADEVESVQRKTLLTRPIDLLLMTFLLGVMVFTVFRGLVVLDCPLDSCFNYIYQYEPYLKDPVGYPRVMMMTERCKQDKKNCLFAQQLWQLYRALFDATPCLLCSTPCLLCSTPCLLCSTPVFPKPVLRDLQTVHIFHQDLLGSKDMDHL